MRPFSEDLRERIVHAVLVDGLTSREVADRFQVSQRTVTRYCQLYRETGDLTPKRSTGRPRLFTSGDEAALIGQLRTTPTATLRELRVWWHERSGHTSSLMTIWRMIRRVGWTRKKGRWWPVNETRCTGQSGEPTWQ